MSQNLAKSGHLEFWGFIGFKAVMPECDLSVWTCLYILLTGNLLGSNVGGICKQEC